MRYDLQELYDAANWACEWAFHDREKIKGAVNWADIRCTSAELAVDNFDDQVYRVNISEADPGAQELHTFIRAHLAAKGFDKVEIVTEW
jgi:hypothetical protein